jgi:hypothetical protein
MKTMRTALPVVLVGTALATAGCGGTASSGSNTAGATGSVGGTVKTVSTPTSTTAEGSASFDVRFRRLRQQLMSGLKQVENGSTADKIVGAGTVLSSCTDTVTNQLGTRAATPKQQEQVSRLRTACSDAANAVAKLKSGDNSAAADLARTALQEAEQAK